MGANLPFLIRAGKPSDRAFVENAWRATMLATSPACVGADPKAFHNEMTRLFERLLPSATVRVACDPKDPDTLVGFVCFTGPELHYVYVAGPFRKLGVVPMLLAGLDITRFTFKTLPGERRLKPKERSWVFAPKFTL